MVSGQCYLRNTRDSLKRPKEAPSSGGSYGVMASDGMGPKGPGAGYIGPESLGELGDDAAVSVIELTGVIKWFDVSKGYGFIIPDNGLPDVLLHVTCLRRDGFQTAYEGARVVCEVLQ